MPLSSSSGSRRGVHVALCSEGSQREMDDPLRFHPRIRSKLLMSERKHICVVGGGIIGSSTAYFLSKHPSNPKVTLLEGTSIAAGASGKAGGLLALDWYV